MTSKEKNHGYVRILTNWMITLIPGFPESHGMSLEPGHQDLGLNIGLPLRQFPGTHTG